MLSVIIPVYNERDTLGTVLSMISRCLPNVVKEIIVVDDCSNDGTREWLISNFPKGQKSASTIDLDKNGNLLFASNIESKSLTIRLIFHPQNKGKGGALQTGFAMSTGDVIVIQDADLEYDPNDLAVMYNLIAVRKVADAVFSSRFHGFPHRAIYLHHYLGNRLISTLFNLLFNQTLTDVEACYKMMTTGVMRSLRLSANDFGIEIEICAEIARQKNLRIYEVGISYFGRTYAEGKKVDWHDGLRALWYLFKYRFR